MTEIAWLVECPKYHPGEYFALCECGCGRHHWTRDVHKATKFASKEEAETARGGDTNCIAFEHEFGLKIPRPMTSPDDVQALIERLNDLRVYRQEVYKPGPDDVDDALHQAADALTAALGEIGELREGLLIYRRVTSVDLLEPDELAKIDALLERKG